ncbi:GspE/PulE family protein [Avibacterium sp. 21-594]|uniref:GspE/PulE family protein n=1 Tax=Avibacterium sp. 21-594 TaxID=2911535 RepID=UPI002245D739|nr:GspE/PulE family protein [Avibacterium sp. 21-594]MCW9715382.1 GspE/PulE family protein [Avibacterium sp. 21-594]
MNSYAFETSRIVQSADGKQIKIPPHLWEKNQQQKELLLRYFALPLKEDEQHLWLAIDDLKNLAACETFAFMTGKIIEPILFESNELKRLLKELSPQVEENSPVLNFYMPKNDVLRSETESENQDEPVIQLLNQIFEQALQKNASDIHIEPQSETLQLRFRVDGVLQCQPTLSEGLAQRIISRLKLLARLDISETRLPQDGRFQFKTHFADVLDFRLSTLPTAYGEKAVLRLQKNKPISLDFTQLGMTETQQRTLQQALSQPQGLILVTGPTGSGKSITLYTALDWLNGTEKHILTAEDPIEITVPGVIQTQINPQIGLDFNRLLRTFLRQDPDIIMLGEIRDSESASIALRAAQTGHLVLSTLHTNDAPSAIARLKQLGIAQYEIENSLLLVIAQRLIRKKCTHQIPCDCHQGYAGRCGIYQFLQPHFENQQFSYQLDFPTLKESGLQKVQQNITDLAELERVLGRS